MSETVFLLLMAVSLVWKWICRLTQSVSFCLSALASVHT